MKVYKYFVNLFCTLMKIFYCSDIIDLFCVSPKKSCNALFLIFSMWMIKDRSLSKTSPRSFTVCSKDKLLFAVFNESNADVKILLNNAVSAVTAADCIICIWRLDKTLGRRI